MPRMNAIMERWIRTCSRELLDRTLILNQRPLLHTLRHYEMFYNGHRPHQGIANARPLAPLPTPITDPDRLTRLDIRRATTSAASSTNANMPPELPGRVFGRHRVDATEFHLDPGRICVMLSRHRHGCIVVGRAGTADILLEHPDNTDLVIGEPEPQVDGVTAHHQVLEHLGTHRIPWSSDPSDAFGRR
jgi:hypothetical protein